MATIHKYNIALTDITVYTAWEPSGLMGPHQTISHIGGEWLGKIGTKRPPDDIEALPAYTETRAKAVQAWYRGEAQRAIDAILATCPDAAYGDIVDDEIHCRDLAR